MQSYLRTNAARIVLGLVATDLQDPANRCSYAQPVADTPASGRRTSGRNIWSPRARRRSQASPETVIVFRADVLPTPEGSLPPDLADTNTLVFTVSVASPGTYCVCLNLDGDMNGPLTDVGTVIILPPYSTVDVVTDESDAIVSGWQGDASEAAVSSVGAVHGMFDFTPTISKSFSVPDVAAVTDCMVSWTSWSIGARAANMARQSVSIIAGTDATDWVGNPKWWTRSSLNASAFGTYTAADVASKTTSLLVGCTPGSDLSVSFDALNSNAPPAAGWAFSDVRITALSSIELDPCANGTASGLACPSDVWAVVPDALCALGECAASDFASTGSCCAVRQTCASAQEEGTNTQ